jgi:transposase-like protein
MSECHHNEGRVVARPLAYKPPIPADKRQQIIAGALEMIEQGHTIASCASKHGLHTKTLKVWLLSLGDEYAAFRSRLIDNKLIDAEEEMERAGEEIARASPDELPRARAMLDAARAKLASAQWVAERRDRRYASKQEVAITHRLDLADAMADADRRLGMVVDITPDPQGVTQDSHRIEHDPGDSTDT